MKEQRSSLSHSVVQSHHTTPAFTLKCKNNLFCTARHIHIFSLSMTDVRECEMSFIAQVSYIYMCVFEE